MGFPGKQQHPQSDGSLESEGKKWVIAGISIRSTTLKPIITKSANRDRDEDDESCSTTPTSADARIPEKLPCPPAPRKRRPIKCNNFLGVREFFNPPDLETVFIRHVERAN